MSLFGIRGFWLLLVLGDFFVFQVFRDFGLFKFRKNQELLGLFPFVKREIDFLGFVVIFLFYFFRAKSHFRYFNSICSVCPNILEF